MNSKNFNLYLSNAIYDNLVPQKDFFRVINDLIDWYDISFDLKFLANNDHAGRPRYPHDIIFKMFFLSSLYNISDRETENLCTNNIRIKYFLGLDITQPAPDFSLLSIYRKQIINKFGAEWINDVFYKILKKIKQAGISIGKIKALDSTHSIADVNISKYNKDKDNDDKNFPRDPDASWGCKGTEKRRTKTNKSVDVLKYFFGYKTHILAESNLGIITGISVSPGNVADINAGEDLVINQLIKKRKQKIDFLTADKAYGCAILIGILEKDYNTQTAFCLNKNFLKGKYKQRWQNYLNDLTRQKQRKKRYIVEQVNADLKNNHGLSKCKYLGLSKYNFQATMTAIVHNLKRTIKVLFGLSFKLT